MTAIETFHKTFGGRWSEIVREPAFQEAMQIANLETIKEIGSLTPEQIKDNGTAILAELKGRLAHENALIELSVAEPRISREPEPEYPSPEEEALEAMKSNGEPPPNPEEVLARFNVPQRTSIPDPEIKPELTVKEKRQQNAAKARAAKQTKYRAKLKKKLQPKP